MDRKRLKLDADNTPYTSNKNQFQFLTEEQIRIVRPEKAKGIIKQCYEKILEQDMLIEDLKLKVIDLTAKTIESNNSCVTAKTKTYYKNSPLSAKQVQVKSRAVVCSVADNCVHQGGGNPDREQQIREAVIDRLTTHKDLDCHALLCVQIIANIASMMKHLNAASTSVSNCHVKLILATAVSGDNISNATLKKATCIGFKALRAGKIRRVELLQIPVKEDSRNNTHKFTESAEEVIMLPDRPRNNGMSRRKRTFSLVHNTGYSRVFAHRHRKRRSDKRSNKFVNEFLHNDQNGARVDTDKNSKRIPIRQENGHILYENVRYFRHGVYDTYLLFLQSDSFTSYQHENTITRKKKVVNPITGKREIHQYREVPATISFRAFTTALCPCARLEGQRDCADEPSRAMAYALDAWKRMRTNPLVKAYRENCVQTNDTLKDKINFASSSLEAFSNLVCCEKENLENISVHSNTIFSREELEAFNIEAITSQHANFELTMNSYSRAAAEKVLEFYS